MIVVFDIDGVLADARHREHHLAGRPRDWDAFFAGVGEDPVIEAGRDRLLGEAARHVVVLLSGRPERCRSDTLDWLAVRGFPVLRLVLRPDEDHRPAADFKASAIGLIGAPDQVAVVVDDDPLIVERLEGLGYTTELFR